MVIDTTRQPLFELIFRLALRGRNCGQIATTVNERGWVTKPVRRCDTPRPFDIGKDNELLKNPRYAGLSVYEGEVLARGHWPAYVTERQHRRIVGRLTRPRGPVTRLSEPYLLDRDRSLWGLRGRRLRVLNGRPRPGGTYVRRYACGSHQCWRQLVTHANKVHRVQGAVGRVVGRLRRE